MKFKLMKFSTYNKGHVWNMEYVAWFAFGVFLFIYMCSCVTICDSPILVESNILFF